ncbi:MFS transporter [Alicyclobacillaceae bacterium I2511]|nr:MFS transporter [Alicyclobacillaceae bacterium I2511]
MTYLEIGSPAFRRANWALFAGGFATFAVLYCVQPLLPIFSQHFHISPVVASLSLSVSTLVLAVAMLVVASLSEAWGRWPVMWVSLLSASLLCALSALSPNYLSLLGLRMLEGAALAGLPATAMGYLGEEVQPRALGMAMGLYISGNTVGGLGGRLVSGFVADAASWRWALAATGALGLLCTLLFAWWLPPSKNFSAKPLNWAALFHSLLGHLRNPRLWLLYVIAALLMSGFVTLYNYATFAFSEPPYGLSPSWVSLIFLLYLLGTFSSVWIGRLADRRGRPQMLLLSGLLALLGVVLTQPISLVAKIAGIGVFTFGFFGAHATASGWVGRLAKDNKAQASSLYLLFYYTGSSVGGSLGGLVWSASGWHGIVLFVAGLVVVALVATGLLWMRPDKTQRPNSMGGQ